MMWILLWLVCGIYCVDDGRDGDYGKLQKEP